MSTILDALKKSEQERKRTNVPTLSDIPAPQERSRWPIILLAILLVLALLAIIWLLMMPDSTNIDPTSSSEREDMTLDQSQSVGMVEDSQDEQEPTDINVDIISYSQDANQSFVIMDGKMYREGDFVRTGLKIQTIEQDSVLLNDRGELVSRQP